MGPDTLTYFGDGRFQILSIRSSDSSNRNQKSWVLVDYNVPKEALRAKRIDTDVAVYKEKKPYLYAIGEKGYTKLNYESGELIQSDNINNFNESDIKLLKKMTDKKTGRIKKIK